MNKKIKTVLIWLREISLIAHLGLSLGLCYMIAETISIFIQYFYHIDIVLTHNAYRYAFIYPNVILLTLLYILIRRKSTIKPKHLIFIPSAFYAVHYILILLLAGVKNTIGWSLYGRVSDGWNYHLGLREYYCSLINRFHERINLWDAKEVLFILAATLILYIGSLFLYRFLRKYIEQKTKTANFAKPVKSADFFQPKKIKKRRISKLLIGFREFSLVGYLFFSLALCYMIAESVAVVYQLIWEDDIVLTQLRYEAFYILPNIILLIILFFRLRYKDSYKIQTLIPAQIAFYIIYLSVVLIIFAKDFSISWYQTSDYLIYLPKDHFHHGLRSLYTISSIYSIEFYNTTPIWIRLGFAFLMFIGFGILYSLLRNYIKRQ